MSGGLERKIFKFPVNPAHYFIPVFAFFFSLFSTVKGVNWPTPYVPCPVLSDRLFYFTQSNQTILSCVEENTGRVKIERTRLPGLSNVYASLDGTDDHIYIIGRY